MSFEASAWAWKQTITATQKIALLALAQCHNEATKQCNPHLTYIKVRTCLDRKTVVRVLQEMEFMGLFTRSRDYGKGYWYDLNFDLVITERPPPKVPILTPVPKVPKTVLTKVPILGRTKVPKTVLNCYIEKEVEKEVESKTLGNASIPSPTFDDFWSQWPKKVAKEDALKAWTKVKPDQQAFDSIIANLQSHANAGDWNITRYIPNPGKYLRQKLWQDTVYPAQEERQKSLSEKISEATNNPTDWAKHGTFGNKFNSSLIS